jgi:NADH dehydrogenase
MSSRILTASQFVARPVDEVAGFFESPGNITRITPSSMRLHIRSQDLAMRSGLEIEYDVRPLPFMSSLWRTRIVDYDPSRGFTDVQLRGPYRRWEHHHAFRAVDGGTQVDDRVEYELPLGPLGGIGHRLIVKSELERIFGHRARAVDAVLEPAGVLPAGETRLRVAIAGGTGFVGGAIARELRRRGHQVIVLSSRGEAGRDSLPDDIDIRVVDVASGAGLPEALGDVQALAIALAFRNSPIESPRAGQTFEAVDAAGTERLVAAARQAGVASVLYMSGAGAAPDAKRHWFRAKWRAEEAVRGSGLRWTILRPTWIYGPDDVSLNRFIEFARWLPFVPLTNRGRQRLAPVFIDDVATASADLLVRPAGAETTFEIGGPEELELAEIIRRAIVKAGVLRPLVPGPTPLIKVGAAPLRLMRRPWLTPDAIDFVNQPAVADPAPLEAVLGWRMRGLDDGLATYLDRMPPGVQLAFGDQPTTNPIEQTLDGSSRGSR